MADPWEAVAASMAGLGVALDPAFERRARVFLQELQRWSRVGRLAGYRTEAQQLEHLVLESLLLLAVLPAPASPILDVGTGPGVPGLILKFARPAWRVVLVDAHRRRTNFVRHVVRTLGLEDVEVHQARAEALARRPEFRRAFRTVTLRAVAPLPEALPLAHPFLHAAGHAVIPLAPDAGPAPGRIATATLAGPGLSVRRGFLIIGAAELSAHVSRGTVSREAGRRQSKEARGPRSGCREPEGRGGQNDDRHQSGGSARRR